MTLILVVLHFLKNHLKTVCTKTNKLMYLVIGNYVTTQTTCRKLNEICAVQQCQLPIQYPTTLIQN